MSGCKDFSIEEFNILLISSVLAVNFRLFAIGIIVLLDLHRYGYTSEILKDNY